ncbi:MULTISPECIES: FAD/NAD(P)-binding oxidoreductase [unclassified Pseudoclavibacter]|uniref:NAD(P)/FAD-dependent oxidoreductase n=1 Tax=unclassified Pseudoclavibacter TaxID=2615177 RepID=UPI000CE8E72F|nr:MULTISPECIES: FAD/NAD(P)-binding oxidoreductase [unclassified Pseudoclavibacter]MBF4550219.1 FAD-dependent oxidoreductase [Pseudoclavibacter sp. VKM Ac-2888]PPF38677.1 pyridine nucleotide-disulfide oxidoreductase [Pseudoclavibacter sp. AY1H1]
MRSTRTEQSTPRHVAVVGGGPAGLAAALAAAEGGARVTLIESSRELGGQYWRHLPEERDGEGQAAMHHGWSTFLDLDRRVRSHARITVLGETSVWAVGLPALELLTGMSDAADRVRSTLEPDAVVVATGAHDRTLPFPGWDLPGVYTGGAAQAFAKSERIAVGDAVVVAGAGPFLLPVAASLAQVGSKVVEVVEANRIPRLASGWLPKPWQLAGAPGKVQELFGYVAGQLRHRIPYRVGEAVVEAHGDGRVERVTIMSVDAQWRPIAGSEREVACDAVCVTHGFTPRLEVAIAAGCALDDSRFVIIDESCATSTSDVYAAGEVTGIGGVDLSLAEGRVAGHCAAGGASSDPQISGAQRKRAIFGSFAARIEAAHGVRPGWQEWLREDTIVCRCEEVTAGQLRRKAAATHSHSLRSQKLSTRAGLGICQARICGRSAEELIETVLGRGLDEGIVDRRPIQTPIRLAELAGTSEEQHPLTGRQHP